jgi:hypothetical protein
VFPVRYELDLYILFGQKSVFKGLTRGRDMWRDAPLAGVLTAGIAYGQATWEEGPWEGRTSSGKTNVMLPQPVFTPCRLPHVWNT